MLDEDKIAQLRGAKLIASGEEIGEVEEIYAHRAENKPALALVRAEERRVLVPLPGPEVSGGRIEVDWPAEKVRQAPEASGDSLGEDDTKEVFAHFGITDADLTADDAHPGAIPDGGAAKDLSSPGGAEDQGRGHAAS